MQHLLGWEPDHETAISSACSNVTSGGAIYSSLEASSSYRGRRSRPCIKRARSDGASRAGPRIARPLGIGFLGLGMTPNWSRAEIPMMPKGRYRIMTAYMPKGRKIRSRHDVPHLHGANQPRLLRRSRHGEEAAGLARAAAGGHRHFVQFAIYEGKANGFSLFRSEIWRDTDRSLRHAAMGHSSWAWVSSDMLTTPSTCQCISSNAGNIISMSPANHSGLMQGRLPGMPGECATVSDWANHISTIFPRSASSVYRNARCGRRTLEAAARAAAYWVGILYDDDALAPLGTL